ncbi:MAG: DUF2461 domain-containing protein [Flavobacteriaceae bacterium]
MGAFNGFGQGFFSFFRELAANNSKEWFEANRTRYREEVQAPLSAFVEAMAPHIHAISPRFNADPRPNGKTIFRIHRDVRFSRDKRPYKEHAACHFRHAGENDVHGPGFYVHLAPSHVGLGAGIWMPSPPSLEKIRRRIEGDAKGWQSLRDLPGMAADMERMEVERLKNPPRGFQKDHPHIEDLKRKSFVAMREYGTDDAGSGDFVSLAAGYFRDAAPLNAWLARALALPF